MAITTNWWLKDIVIGIVMAGDFTAEDLTSAANTAYALIDSSDEPYVHVLLDNTDIGQTKARAAEMNRAAQPLMKHGRLGWLVVYGKNNVLTRFATNVVMQLVHNRFRMVNTLEEALDFLTNLHDQIPNYETWQGQQTASTVEAAESVSEPTNKQADQS
ncbi:MAG: hypothetical protein KC546_04645 [Anaerolineae bacterium]|nr:hypothetical protein [Anaerolineae bacterium]MCA9893342.1 hypothetical protein [Anaerolineae bacterium]